MFEFPDVIKQLSKAIISFPGCTAYIVQGEKEQVLFMQFQNDVELPEHTHEAQWGIVLSGEINLVIDGEEHTFKERDNYYIPKVVRHRRYIKAGYSDITYFNQKDRYSIK